MQNNFLHYNTVTPLLRQVLHEVMQCDLFLPFRLVGGTSLSLQLGHRMSDDIDLFTDAEYRTVDFHTIQNWLRNHFPYCMGECGEVVGFGCSYMVGKSPQESVKLDLFYTDKFIRPAIENDELRIASIEDIAAMKLGVVSRGGRKKDFWDLHCLHGHYTISEMLDLYEEQNPYGSSRSEVIEKLTDFSRADTDADPRCLQHKVWQLIKLDILEWDNR